MRIESFFIIYVSFFLLAVMIFWIRQNIRVRHRWIITEEHLCTCVNCGSAFLSERGNPVARCPKCDKVNKVNRRKK
ncbi:MAG: hypothetical protein U9O87_00720 [Verrucomicrobiota bacterium]|nr:hypothetical protein [Verrucomicrobiota bacterium]